MFNILLISHGKIAKGFYETLPMLLGTQEGFASLCFEESMDVNEFEKQMHHQIQDVWKDDEILVLADMLGGTPSRVAVQELKKHGKYTSLICGLNLNLMVDAFVKKEQPLKQVEESILQAGMPSFMQTSESCINEEDE